MNYAEKEKAIILAGAMHDLGKINYFNKKLDFDYSKDKKHAVTSTFFVQKLNLEKNLLDEVLSYVKHHHSNPHTVVSEADKISSKERDYLEEDEKGDPKREPIKSVFSLINPVKENEFFFPLHFLTNNLFESDFKPVDSKEEAIQVSYGDGSKIDLKETYSFLEKKLLEEISSIDFNNFDKGLIKLDSVLKKYLLFVPSARYVNVADVSLYNHLQTTSAIALTLNRSRDKKVLLIEGDVSGIQNFIFNSFKRMESDEHASKRLRGRSFFINLLVEAVVFFIRKELNLPVFNIFLKSGGHFILLAPYSSEIEEKLKKIREQVNDFLFELFGSQLFFSIAWKQGTINDLNPENYSNFLFSLKNELNMVKENKFKSKLGASYSNDFSLSESNVCVGCGRNKREANSTYCRVCSNLIELGGKLVKSSVLNVFLNKPNCDFVFNFGETSICFNLGTESDKSSFNSINLESFDLNNFDSFSFLGSFAPKNKFGFVKSFEDLCSLGNNVFAKLGVLKADVDDLGFLFAFGLGKSTTENELKTVSRLNTMSSLFNLFFSNKLKKIAEKNNCYVVFSGGDDLIVVGRFDELIRFSISLKKEFDEWVNNNSITFSAGISFSNHKFPIKQLIELSDAQLNKSKQKEKNKVSLFNSTVEWSVFQDSWNYANDLIQLLKEKKISFSLVFQLLKLKEKYFSENKFGLNKGEELILHPEPYVKYSFKRNSVLKEEELDKIVKKIVSFFDEEGKIELIVSFTSLLKKYNLGGSDFEL